MKYAILSYRNMDKELTIVIPAKNEEERIGILMESILRQDYENLSNTKVILADAQSTDHTREKFSEFGGKIDTEIIKGGPVAVGRNNGAARAKSEFVLFLDADIALGENDTIRKAVSLAKRKNLDCVGTYVKCENGNFLDHLLYTMNNLLQFLSRFISPFTTGMFMLFRKSAFDALGGFDEKAFFGEDYLLSSLVPNKKFGIVSFVYTTNRRFKKTGYLKMVRMVGKIIIHFKDRNYIRSREYKEYWNSSSS